MASSCRVVDAAASSVQVLHSSLVKPLHPTERFHFYLPLADTSFEGLHPIRDVLFYGDLASSFDLTILKHGLSVALVDFYPVAGRLSRGSDSADLTIDCNDNGVEFVEAVAHHDFEDLKINGFPIHDFYEDLARCSPGREKRQQQDAPLLSIQVTSFQDGCGIAIGFAASHVVFDGHSLWHFLNVWGQCCRGLGVGVPPFHVRAVTKPECWFSKPVQSEQTVAVFNPPMYQTALYHKIMHFSSAAVQQLKEAAVKEAGNTRLSAFQSVIACVWKRMVVAEGLSPHEKVCLCLPVNLRQRLRPSLTTAYFGNASETLYVHATASDLINGSEGAIAIRINESLKVLDDDAYLREMLARHRFAHFISEASKGSIKFMFVSCGSKLPVHSVDVGMGKPCAVRPSSINNDALVVVYPSKEAGGIDVCVRFSSMQTFNAFLSIPSPCIDI